MSEITKSASKVVLLAIIAVLCIITLVAAIVGVVRGSLEPVKDIISLFGSALSFVLGFYFGSKGDPSQPYAGK